MTISKFLVRILPLAILAFYPLVGSAQPPEVRVLRNTSNAILGQPYEVIFEVSWPGQPGDRSVLPPSHVNLEWADLSAGSSEATVRDGANVVRHGLTFIPRETGSFEVPAMTLAYLNPADLPNAESEEESTPPVYPTISAESFEIQVVQPIDPLTIVFGGAALVALLALGTVVMRRRQIAAANESEAIPMPTVPDAINAARQHRLDRRHYEFYLALIRGVSLLSGTAEHKQMKTILEKKAKEVGFQNYQPNEDELDGALRDLERALNQDKGPKA